MSQTTEMVSALETAVSLGTIQVWVPRLELVLLWAGVLLALRGVQM